jgi:hypothetical protein
VRVTGVLARPGWPEMGGDSCSVRRTEYSCPRRGTAPARPAPSSPPPPPLNLDNKRDEVQAVRQCHHGDSAGRDESAAGDRRRQPWSESINAMRRQGARQPSPDGGLTTVDEGQRGGGRRPMGGPCCHASRCIMPGGRLFLDLDQGGEGRCRRRLATASCRRR